MKILIAVAAACIMAGAMNAQTLIGLPENKVELAGSPESPFVINGSAKTIVAYVLKKTDDEGHVSVDSTRFYHKHLATGLPIGPGSSDVSRTSESGAMRVHHDGTPLTFKTISIDLVLFSDGTTAGPDSTYTFDAFEKGFKMDKATLIKALLDLEGRKK